MIMAGHRFSANRDPDVFLQFITRYGFDINPGDRCILAKKAKNAMKNHILKPLTFCLIMLSSIQVVEIPLKLTVFIK